MDERFIDGGWSRAGDYFFGSLGRVVTQQQGTSRTHRVGLSVGAGICSDEPSRELFACQFPFTFGLVSVSEHAAFVFRALASPYGDERRRVDAPGGDGPRGSLPFLGGETDHLWQERLGSLFGHPVWQRDPLARVATPFACLSWSLSVALSNTASPPLRMLAQPTSDVSSHL